jgi:four helix bundle protein
MKYDRFEDLPVWKRASELALQVYALTRDGCFVQQGDLGDQLRRAALSVSNNIAEGFERGSTAELLMFLYIARGSAGEVRSMCRFLEKWPDSAHLRHDVSSLVTLAESCSRQLRGWADSLQNSDIKGQRHLTDASRREYELRERSVNFQEKLQEQLRADHPEWFPDTKDED